MYLMVLRNPELNNAVYAFQVDHPLSSYCRNKKHQISRVYRSSDGVLHYSMSDDECINNIIREGRKTIYAL
jgi:hypothetical protein